MTKCKLSLSIAVGLCFTMVGCGTTKEIVIPRTVKVAVPVEAKTTLVDRPTLAISENAKTDSANVRAERLLASIEQLMIYSLRLECLLTPFVINPRPDACLKNDSEEDK